MSTEIIEWNGRSHSHELLQPELANADSNIEVRHPKRNLKFTILADCYVAGSVVVSYLGIYYSVTGSDHQTIYWDDIERGKYDEQQGFFGTRIEEEAPHEQESDTIVI